jgi:hypothetical protein
VPTGIAPVLFRLALAALAAPYAGISALGARKAFRELARPYFLAAGVAVWRLVRTGVHALLLAYFLPPIFTFVDFQGCEIKGFIPS